MIAGRLKLRQTTVVCSGTVSANVFRVLSSCIYRSKCCLKCVWQLHLVCVLFDLSSRPGERYNTLLLKRPRARRSQKVARTKAFAKQLGEGLARRDGRLMRQLGRRVPGRAGRAARLLVLRHFGAGDTFSANATGDAERRVGGPEQHFACGFLPPQTCSAFQRGARPFSPPSRGSSQALRRLQRNTQLWRPS